MVNSVMHHLAMKVAPELGDIFVIGIQDGSGAGVKLLDQLVFGAGDVGDGGKEFQVHRRDVGHHSYVRVRQLGQRCDLAGMRHAELDDRDLVLRLQFQQLQWQAEMIVKIAFRLHHAEPRGENVSDSFLGRRLSG